MDLGLKGLRALVSGGTKGIGRAIAGLLVDEGASVAICARDEGDVKATTADLQVDGNSVYGEALDVSDGSSLKSWVTNAADSLNGLDIVVNNAGIFEQHPVGSIDFDEWCLAWQKIIGVNLIGPANICYLASQHMMQSGGGRIVNISSRGAFRGEPDSPAYGASKAGVNAFSQSLAVALAPHNIFIGVVAPGFVETDMAANILASPAGDAIRAQSPLGRVARPEEIASAVLFLASDGAEFTTGTIIDVNGASYLRS